MARCSGLNHVDKLWKSVVPKENNHPKSGNNLFLFLVPRVFSLGQQHPKRNKKPAAKSLPDSSWKVTQFGKKLLTPDRGARSLIWSLSFQLNTSCIRSSNFSLWTLTPPPQPWWSLIPRWRGKKRSPLPRSSKPNEKSPFSAHVPRGDFVYFQKKD